MADEGGGSPAVLVRWSLTTDRAWAHRELLAEAARLTGRARAELRLRHVCARCGSDGHGRPIVTDGHRPLRLDVSLSRTHDLSVLAVATSGRVGIDVERATATAFEGLASVALHRDEHAADDRERALLWSRKESLLKALGSGLTVDLRTVRVSAPAQAPYVVTCPGLDGPGEPAWLTDLDLGQDYAACLTVLAPSRPDVSLERVGREARSP